MKDIDFRTHPAAEREWQAQEGQAGPYAAVTRAARQAMEPGLPADFAERVATLAQAQARARRQPARFEAWLIGTLLATMIGGAAAFLVTDAHALDTVRQPWLLVLAGCAALTQGIAWLRPTGRRG
jgi:hypothetical protein